MSHGGAGGLYHVGGVVLLVGFASVASWAGCSWWVLPVLTLNQACFPNVALRLPFARVVTPCLWCV